MGRLGGEREAIHDQPSKARSKDRFIVGGEEGYGAKCKLEHPDDCHCYGLIEFAQFG